MAAVFILIFILSVLGQWFAPSLADPQSIITDSVFNQLFPDKNAFYTYNDFISAAGSFPQFGSTGDETVQKQELAAFFANVKQETGSLQYVEEIDKSGNYCDSATPCPAGNNQYYGRGPLQLTWNYNYKAAGDALGIDLLDNPSLLATNGVDSWESALWFWNSNPNPITCHQAMVENQGFGQTIRIINGGIECGKGSETPQATNRINYYRDICSVLNVDPGSNLSCA